MAEKFPNATDEERALWDKVYTGVAILPTCKNSETAESWADSALKARRARFGIAGNIPAEGPSRFERL